MKKLFTLFLAFFSVVAFVQKANAIEFRVVVPSPTYEAWVVGNFNGWNNNQHKMTLVEGTTNIYALTIPDDQLDGQTTATIKYKYLSGGGDWAYVEKSATGEEISDRNYPGVGVNDTVKTWALVFNPNVAPIAKNVKIEVQVPPTVKDLYLTGSHTAWKSPGSEGTKMTFNAEESDATASLFYQTIYTEDANKLIYKFAAGPSWVYEQDSTDLKMPDVTLNEVFHYMPKFKRIYPGDANLKTVTITVTAPAGTENVYMMGSHLGWDGSSWAPGVKGDNNTFTFTVQNVDLMEYKYYRGQGWDFEEKTAAGEGVGNRKADAQVAVTFTDVIEAWSTTSVPAINMDKYTIYTSNGRITVEGVTSKAEVFDVTGRMMQQAVTSGTFTSNTLNAGIYILRVDGATMKVMVK